MTGQGTAKTTSELQAPTGYTGIYANWNLNLDGVTGNDGPVGLRHEQPVPRHQVQVHPPPAGQRAAPLAQVTGLAASAQRRGHRD